MDAPVASDLAARAAKLLLAREFYSSGYEEPSGYIFASQICDECGATFVNRDGKHDGGNITKSSCETGAVCDALRALGYGDPRLHADACPCDHCAARIRHGSPR